jgi:hypothetical protein
MTLATDEEADYAACAISLVSTSPQSAQRNICSSGHGPIFGIDRTNFMTRWQRGQLFVGVCAWSVMKTNYRPWLAGQLRDSP